MQKGFLKQKKKYILGSALKCAACAVSCGLVCVGAVLLALKLSAISLNAGYYVLIALGGAAIGGAISFAILRPTDAKLAKRLDADYGLHERTQTALEFTNESGVVVEMQRGDAEETLQALPYRRPSFSRMWQYIALGVLALALAVAAIAVPARKEAIADPRQEPFEATELQIVAVQELIDNVKGCDLEVALKDPAAARLERLLAEVQAATTVGQMQDSVYGAISDVMTTVSFPNNAAHVADAAWRKYVSYLSAAIVNGSNVYRKPDLASYSGVKAFARENADYIAGEVAPYMNAFAESLNVNIANGLSMRLTLVISALGDTVEAAQLPATDPFSVTIAAFAAQLTQYKGMIDASTMDDEAAHKNFTTLCGLVSDRIVEALEVQTYRLAVGRHVDLRLCSVFGLTSQYEQPFEAIGAMEGDSVLPSTPDDDETHEGGIGEGDLKYGSNESVYDPDSGEYVQYGTLLGRYYAIVEEYLRGGTVTPEMEAAIRAYLSILAQANAQ